MAKETENKVSRLDAKREAAENTKNEINERIEELRVQILDESDEKVKKQLRKEREELIERRNGIVISDDKVSVPMKKSSKKKLQACIAVVLVVALLCAYVATGLAKKGFISTLGYPQRTFTGLVLTDSNGKKHNIKTVTYNYYYATAYNNLEQQQSYLSQLSGLGGGSGSDDSIDFDKALSEQETTDEDGKKTTWDKKLNKQVMDSIKEHYALYYAAVDANNGKEPEITEDQQKEIDDTLKEIGENATKNKYTLDAYLSLAIAYGVNSEVFRREETVKYIADNYKENYKFTDEEYDKYLKDHKEDLLGVDIKYFEATSEDDAKAFVDELKDDGSNFEELASKYAEDDWDKTANLNEDNVTYYNLTKSNLMSMGGAIGVADESEDDNAEKIYKGLEWLYSDKRKAGDKKNYSTSVVYVIKPSYLYKGNTVNVRHILIQPEKKSKDDDGKETTETVQASEASEKQLKKAEKKANEVYEEFKKGDKTSDSFAALAKKYSGDGNASTGGLYEDIPTNQMVPVFNNWCFDKNRKAGDSAIVLSEFGYHIMYFEGATENPVWHKLADSVLSADESDSSLKNITEKAKLKTSFIGSRYFVKDVELN